MQLSDRSWRNDHLLWVEVFVTSNFAFLVPDIYMAHSVNAFRHWAEYVPFYCSIGAPLLLTIALLARSFGKVGVWVALGHFVGWNAIAVGLAGVLFHLQSAFFWERTLKSLTYAAPFAAPLAYTGLGLLLVLDRMISAQSKEWAEWVLLMALGGFAGNFVLSLTDHAVNGFFHATEWLPVISSAFAVGFLIAPFFARVDRPYLIVCVFVMLVQALVGLLGFGFHVAANLKGPSTGMLQNFIDGAPPFAPLLLPNLMVLALISLWALEAVRLEQMESESIA